MPSNNTRRLTAALYLSAGLPFGLFFEAMPTLMRMRAVSLADIGLMSAASLPWSLKLLWSPLMDRVGRTDVWLRAILLFLAATFATMACLVERELSVVSWFCLLLALSLGAALQDTAIDGLFVILHQEASVNDRTRAGGLRVTCYKAAMMLGGGGIIVLGSTWGWHNVLLGVAAAYGLTAYFLPLTLGQQHHSQPESLALWFQALWQWVRYEGSVGTFCFVLLYKLGIASISPLSRALWVDRGIDPTTLGLASACAGLIGTLLGAGLGTFVCRKLSLSSALVVGAATEGLCCLILSFVINRSSTFLSMAACLASEALAQGLTTAALVTCLVRLCDTRHASTQYAALTATFGLTRALAGSAGGAAVDWVGITTFFSWTPWMCLPSLLFLPSVQRRLLAAEQHHAQGA